MRDRDPGRVKTVYWLRQFALHWKPVDAKTKHWSLRVTPAQDMIVCQVLGTNGLSLNEYVVGRAVASAVEDLADRQVFEVSEEAWDKLKEVLARPPTPKPKIAALLAEDSVLD